MRRILALAAFASLLLPFQAAVADDLGAQEDIVVEPERPAPTVVKETVIQQEKPVSLPPPGWKPKPADEKSE